MTTEQERIAILETNEINMSKQISEIKSDIKEIKDDIAELRVVLARWGGGIFIGWILIELGINMFLK